ncbi:Peptidase T [bioreactor metagenome]|uniref:Peptidase T n=1 Tax=bioreactor metagenome TaxID=1076179 RepID=A0A645B0Y9_9ZZZZ
MKNAALVAMEFNAMLPPAQTPAHTENYEGFYHLNSMRGSEEQAVLHYIIRDHDREKFENRKRTMERIAEFLNDTYGEGSFALELKDSYYNMKEKIDLFIVEAAQRAMESVGVNPHLAPIRGGTDGSRLSYVGLPCPNLCTGGYNFHGRYEFISVEAMEKVVNILQALVTSFVPAE